MTVLHGVQVWLVAGDCFLIGLAPVLVHMSKGPDGKFPFHPVSINLLVEVAKTVFATIVLMIYVSTVFCKGPPFLLPQQTSPSAQSLLSFRICFIYGCQVRRCWMLNCDLCGER